MRCRAVLAFALLCVLRLGFAQDDRPPLAFHASKRVYAPTSLQGPELAGLAEALERASRDSNSGLIVYAVLYRDTAQPLGRLAEDLRLRWAGHAGFPSDRSLILVCSLRRTAVALSLPRGIRDRLALSPSRVREQLIAPYFRLRAPNEGLSETCRALTSLARAVLDRLDELQDGRDRRRVREFERQRAEAARLPEALDEASHRLQRTEELAADLAGRGVDVSEEVARLDRARDALARALDAQGFAGGRAREDLAEATKLAREVAERLERLRAGQSRLEAEVLPEVRRRLTEAEARPWADGQSAERKETAREQLRRARIALSRAEAERTAGRPLEALRACSEVLTALDLAARKRAAPRDAAPPPSPPSGFPWAVLFLALGGVAAGGWLLQRSMTRVRERTALEALRETLERQSAAVLRELLALRALHLRVARPRRIATPARLIDEPLPLPAEFQGATARRLRAARGGIEELHRIWRSLEQALLHCAVVDFGRDRLDAPAVVRSLLGVPLKDFPVSLVSYVARELDTIGRGVRTREESLIRCVAALDRVDAAFEGLLQAGHSPLPLADDYGNLLRAALEAAHYAEGDPEASARAEEEVEDCAERILARVERLVALAQRRQALRTRLGEQPSGGKSATREGIASVCTSLLEQAAEAIDQARAESAEVVLQNAETLANAIDLRQEDDATRWEEEVERLRAELRRGGEVLAELQAEFSPERWADVEARLHRAAGRLELIAADLSAGAVPERVGTRLSTVRQAALAPASRLLHARAERERTLGLQETLRKRTTALADRLERDHQAVSTRTKRLFDRAVERLETLAASLEKDPAPRWGKVEFELGCVERELNEVVARATYEQRRETRLGLLERSLEKGLREARDALSRRGARPGVRAAEGRARRMLDLGRSAREAGEPARALACYRYGVRAAFEARDVGYRRGLRSLFSDRGVLGDAQHAILLAGQALGAAHRHYCRGGGSDPSEARRILSEARVALAENPTRALDLAVQAHESATRLLVEAHVREDRQREERLEARRRYGEALQAVLGRKVELTRRAEAHHRARFEILVLSEAPDFGSIDDEDLDADEPEEELAALEAVEAEVAGFELPSASRGGETAERFQAEAEGDGGSSEGDGGSSSASVAEVADLAPPGSASGLELPAAPIAAGREEDASPAGDGGGAAEGAD
ncbi:MAG: hypothetical protein D6731_16460 [Planctomycetota bacterium]|nr:MAG: hypothetical protein D6731_16460 [Planctomycetota bacterium]